MKTGQLNLRLEIRLLDELERAAREDGVDRATMARRLVFEALRQRRLEVALRSYADGSWSAGHAAEVAGISHWELLDLARARGTAHLLTPEVAEARLARLASPDSRVAEPGPAYRAARKLAAGAPATLPDRPPRPGGVLLVGVNPAPASVKAGHYWQGKLGKRLWRRLHRLGLLEDAVPGREDDAFVAAGNGLTDLVKRVTASASEIGRDELRAGAERLGGLVADWKPGLVVFVFKQAARAALGDAGVAPGECGRIGGVRAFLLSSPYASTAETARVDAELEKLLNELRRHAR